MIYKPATLADSNALLFLRDIWIWFVQKCPEIEQIIYKDGLKPEWMALSAAEALLLAAMELQCNVRPWSSFFRCAIDKPGNDSGFDICLTLQIKVFSWRKPSRNVDSSDRATFNAWRLSVKNDLPWFRTVEKRAVCGGKLRWKALLKELFIWGFIHVLACLYKLFRQK